MGQLSSFLKSPRVTDTSLGTPRLTLSFKAEEHLFLDLAASYSIIFTITRDEDDPQAQPCIIHWDPIEDAFGQPGIMIVHSNFDFTEDLEPVQVNCNQLQAKLLQPRVVSMSDPCFRQLEPGSSISCEAVLPSVYFDSFLPGQCYKILWVGGQILLWGWGTLAEHSGRTLGPNSTAVILPGGPRHLLSIAPEESDIEDVGPLPPSPRPLLASSRMSGAPLFSLTITGPATLSMKDRNPAGKLRYSVTVTLSYDAAPNGLDGKPVTFHTFIFKDIDRRQEGFRLYFREKDDWRPHEISGLFTHHEYRFSECVPVNVGHQNMDEFWVLVPGESWSFKREVTDFPRNVSAGDKFRYGFKGAQLDWWDWGDFRDHEKTVVWIDGKVRDPKDNGSRPGLVVPASNWVEFAVIE